MDMMTMRFYRYLFVFMATLALLCGCKKAIEEIPAPEVTDVLPFSVTVQPEKETRASFSGSSLDEGHYIFAEGDKLYITGADGQIHGELSIASGAGTGTATFSGSLVCTGGFEPTASTVLSATLVGSQQSNFFTVADGKITAGPAYPSSIANTTITDLVQKYSHFTASFNYSTHYFTLTQQTVFLNFDLELYRSNLKLSGASPTVQADIKSSGGTVLYSVTGIPVGGNSIISNISFTLVVPPGTTLQGAQTWINNNGGVHLEPDFAADVDLLANHHYQVSRSSVEDFTVEAPSSGTGASVTFNYTPVQYRTYISGVWSDWSDYSSTVTLSPGEKVSFRGKKTSYKNSGSKPLISTVNSVYIYGDIMSLICDDNYVMQSSVGTEAFYQAFKGCTNIDIHPDKDLVLSAETLGTSCYEKMFLSCTSITSAPVLPATTSAASCYKSMFEGCTALETPPDSIPITTVESNACNKMFYNCTSLASSPEFSKSLSVVEESGCSEMFSGCSNLETPPSSLPAGTLKYKAYYKMFLSCSKLDSIPDFPHATGVTYSLAAGTSAENGSQDGLCYQMFYNCSALTSLEGKQLFNSTTPLALGCFNDMFSTCANLATVPEDFLPATTLAASCYRGMFQKCSKLTRAPDLLAATLESRCYQYMFNTCTSLVYIKCYSTSPGSSAYTANWVQKAKNTTACEFHYRSGVAWTNSNDGYLSNWTLHPETVQ